MVHHPRFSLILPCYNEIEHIDKSLEKIQLFLSSLYRPSEYELILIDDFSTDGTRDWLKDVKGSNLRIHYNVKNMGRGATVKKGIQNESKNCGCR